MGYNKVPYRDDGYATYAALASIDVYLSRARANVRQAERELAWLRKLRDRRAGQTDEEWTAEVRTHDAQIAADREARFKAAREWASSG